jgi:mono/diheme cytochrome c family protein
MKRQYLLAFLCLAVLLLAQSARISLQAAAQQPKTTDSAIAQNRAMLDKYCVTCHNQRLKTAALVLDNTNVDLAHPSASAEVWEKVIRKVRAEMMPPVGAPRPEKSELDTLAAYLETSIDKAAAASPNPGRTVLHRHNRAEYGVPSARR